MTLPEFLLARINGDEHEAWRRRLRTPHTFGLILKDIEVRRQAVMDNSNRDGYASALWVLALPYVEHPDWDPRWSR